jgi:hypothetical protein
MEDGAHYRVLHKNITADTEGKPETLRQYNQSVDKT